MMVIQGKRSWKPNRPVSQGANAFHNAVIEASWNHDCLDELVSIVKPNVKEGDVITDFGAGTGTSSVRFLEKLNKIKLWLVDNSPAWLGKAYEFLSTKPYVRFFILDKKNDHFSTLAETVGRDSVDHVLSANTVHLIPNLKDTFKGIFDAIKPNGCFIFNSGNIMREGKPDGALMLDSTVYRVHDIALSIIKYDSGYRKYRTNLYKKIEATLPQRKFVFPYPRDIQEYLSALKEAGFERVHAYYKCFKVKYDDYLKFLRVKRLQAGMLPEIGGKDPNPREEKDRDELITKASLKLFKELEKTNPLADDKAWQCEWTFVSGVKQT